MDMSHEILKPAYVMCNECKNLDKEAICTVYKTSPPKHIICGNPLKNIDNEKICKHFANK